MYGGYPWQYGWSIHSHVIGTLVTGITSGLFLSYLIHIMCKGFLDTKTITFNLFTKWVLALVMLVGALGLSVCLDATSYGSLDAINRALNLINLTSQVLTQHVAFWVEASPLGAGGFLLGILTFIGARTIVYLVTRPER